MTTNPLLPVAFGQPVVDEAAAAFGVPTAPLGPVPCPFHPRNCGGLYRCPAAPGEYCPDYDDAWRCLFGRG